MNELINNLTKEYNYIIVFFGNDGPKCIYFPFQSDSSWKVSEFWQELTGKDSIAVLKTRMNKDLFNENKEQIKNELIKLL